MRYFAIFLLAAVFGLLAAAAINPPLPQSPVEVELRPSRNKAVDKWFYELALAEYDRRQEERLTKYIASDGPNPRQNTDEVKARRRAKIDQAFAEQADIARIVARMPRRATVGTTEALQLSIQYSGNDKYPKIFGAMAAPIDVVTPIAPRVSIRAYALAPIIDVAMDKDVQARQVVSHIAPTLWTWTLTPKDAGETTIVIELKHTLNIDGNDIDYAVDSFPQAISINIYPWKIVTNWLSEGTTVITSFSTFILAAAALIAIFRPGKKAVP